jgi:hypothetical protein
MNEQEAQEALYGGLYQASPGSDRDKEQKRRVRAVMDAMKPKKKPAKHDDEDKKPETFIDKAITKMEGGE